jgi:hypothetical protein
MSEKNQVRTQIRLELGLHAWANEYALKHGLSMNEALNSLLHTGLLEEMENEESVKNRDFIIKIINKRIANLPVRDLHTLASIAISFSRLNGGL